MYKQDLALNNLQGLIYHKTQPINKPECNCTLNAFFFGIIFCIFFSNSADFKCSFAKFHVSIQFVFNEMLQQLHLVRHFV